jgi:hypothetical protein
VCTNIPNLFIHGIKSRNSQCPPAGQINKKYSVHRRPRGIRRNEYWYMEEYYTEGKKTGTKEHVLWNLIYVKFKKNQANPSPQEPD